MGTLPLDGLPHSMLRLRERLLSHANAPRRLALSAILVLAGRLLFSHLSAIGYANHYYTAGVASMLQSWHNLFYVVAEPGGAVSIDKPPLGLLAAGAFALSLSADSRHGLGALLGTSAVVGAMLFTPGVWSALTTFNTSSNQSLPAAYSGPANGAASGPANGGNLQVDQQLLAYLQANTPRALHWLGQNPSATPAQRHRHQSAPGGRLAPGSPAGQNAYIVLCQTGHSSHMIDPTYQKIRQQYLWQGRSGKAVRVAL